MPFGVVKTRQQALARYERCHPFQVMRLIIHEEGVGALWKGKECIKFNVVVKAK